MSNLNERIKASKEKVKQLENQRRMIVNREQEAKRKKEARRHFDFGRLVCKYFPEEDTATFENLLRVLSKNTELYTKVKEEVAKYVLPG